MSAVYKIHVDGKLMSSHEKESDTIKELHRLYKRYPHSIITSRLVVNERYGVDLLLSKEDVLIEDEYNSYP